MAAHRVRFLPERLAIVRLDPAAERPAWAWAGPFASVTRTAEELSIVCAETAVPETARAERGWRALMVEGPLDFEETGVLAALTAPLAETGVPVFTLSTFDTDYLLVRERDLVAATEALRGAGHAVTAEA